ncbi:MAG: chemotaxis protein CheA [Firmicutes bacterium HGW-Firmicutes-16]|nr:MAG: chemotaxis protein CheA [Firmicutes bacterium HGW-Firmicutes-16]
MSTDDLVMESLLEAFIHETNEMLEQLDEILLDSERAKSITDENINSIFRITHTIKGSAAMMSFNTISQLAHSVEDVFFILRENPSSLRLVFNSIFDLVFKASDFFKRELERLQDSEYIEGDASEIIAQLTSQAVIIKGSPEPVSAASVTSAVSDGSDILSHDGSVSILVYFENDCGMENVRAFMLLSQLSPFCDEMASIPANPEADSALAAEIIKNGFKVICKPSHSLDVVLNVIESALSIRSYEVLAEETIKLDDGIADASSESNMGDTSQAVLDTKIDTIKNQAQASAGGVKQSLISVNQLKLDHLMDLVGEIVTAESMVARNPDILGLRLDNFTKSVRELRKLTDELQDIVMSIRMVPLLGTFHKMDRIVRDMGKKLGKKADLITEGGDTEVDKTINDAIVDPLMHMIRNSMDHAIETPEARIALGKPEVGTLVLSARNTGGEILITISDDGAGLDTEKLLAKAKANGMLQKPEASYSEKEIFNLILLPGFSTNTNVTEFSGRGVGMDVVKKNIDQVGGTISINSEKGKGTTFTIKIPLTLAIVDGMNIAVGKTVFTLPITAIRQSFKITDESQIIRNSDGTEMILQRGECFPIARLKKLFDIEAGCENISDGIMIQVDSNNSGYCLFADELLGEYQVVVKPFPVFLKKYNLKNQGISGCSVLGDGSISLILDVNTLRND